MNNKGFAITTILYGTFLLFMMLLLVMLGILSRYKDNLSILMDKTNGARYIIDMNNPMYKADFHLMKVVDRNYYKKNSGFVIAVAGKNASKLGPLLISTDPEAVAYYTDCRTPECDSACLVDFYKNHTYCNYADYVNCDNKKYYYSDTGLWYKNGFGDYNTGYLGTLEYVIKIKSDVKKIIQDRLGITCS